MTTLHFAVVGLADTDPHAFTGVSLAHFGFVIDGDSFVEWGENLTDGRHDGDPIHVTWTTPHDDVPDALVRTLADRLALCVSESVPRHRVVDYTVVTDDVWSENARIVTRF